MGAHGPVCEHALFVPRIRGVWCVPDAQKVLLDVWAQTGSPLLPGSDRASCRISQLHCETLALGCNQLFFLIFG